MKTLKIVCFLCGWSGLLNDYENHLEEKHPNPSCESCGDSFDSVNSLVLHQQNECDKKLVACSLKDFGCFEPIERVHMQDHYLSERHQNAIGTCVRYIIFKLTDRQKQNELTMDIGKEPHPVTTMTTTMNTTTQFQTVYETINVLADGIQVLNEDTQRLSDKSLRVNNDITHLHQDLETVKLSVQEQNIFLSGIKPSQDILSQDVASLKEKINDMQSVSYDGTSIWKIRAVAEKMNDAQSERQTSIYSPPFYSSITGYKMRARLYLHGDGNARRTHMSLFFVLMRGKHDHLLRFPFSYKVTFCLYDQTPAQRHIIDSFRPDIKSNSFQRPRSEMNIASGIPKFVPLAIVEQEGNSYIRDDTMFIKIMVDFGDLPKTILPYALSLNPGLPMNVQQQMITHETKRQSKQKDTTINLCTTINH